MARDLGNGELSSAVYRTAAALVRQTPLPEIIAIDIPIGLPYAGARTCDREARRLLGEPRRRSVFPAPIRAALHTRTREEASRITHKADGRNVSVQAWGLYRKIREVDEILTVDAALSAHVREIHPELCFWAWNRRRPMIAYKKKPAGLAERRKLIDAHFGHTAATQVRSRHSRRTVVADDDIHDAFAALWTAERIFRKQECVIPDPPPADYGGLCMWF